MDRFGNLNFLCCLTLLFWQLGFSAGPLYAQQQGASDSSYMKELEAVLIESGKSRFGIISTTPVQTLSGASLQRLNAFSVADALRYFSGVQIKDYGGVGGLKTINVRNMGTQHVAVILDGIRLNNAQNGTVDLGKYSLDNIEAIQLYNGYHADPLQPALNQFASSVIYLQTQRPVFENNNTYQFKTRFKTGSFGLANPSFLWQQKWGTGTLSANTEYLTANGHYKYRYSNGVYDTTAIRHNGGIEAFRTEASFIQPINNKGELFLKAYYYQSERGLPGAIVSNKYFSPQKLWDRNFFLQGSLKSEISKNYSLLLNSKFAVDYTRYYDPDFMMTSGPLNNQYNQKEGYLSLAQKLKLKNWWSLGLATDVAINTLEANLYRFAYPTRYSYVGAFTSYFNWNRVLLNTGILGVYYHERVKQYQKANDKFSLSPTISFSWQPIKTKIWRLRSFYKESLRMPSFNDLYYSQIGNIFLKPEYTKQWDVGTTWGVARKFSFEEISIQADAYYNQIENKIVAVPAANLFRWMMLNLGRVEIKGAELNLNFVKQFWDSIFWNSSIHYSFQKAVNRTPGQSSYNDQIPYTPIHSGSLHGSLIWKTWALNYSFLYTGERYVLPENIAVNYMQPWYTTDLGIQYDIAFRKQTFKLGLEVNNLFNQFYDVVLNFPMPGRNFRFTLSLNYK